MIECKGYENLDLVHLISYSSPNACNGTRRTAAE